MPRTCEGRKGAEVDNGSLLAVVQGNEGAEQQTTEKKYLVHKRYQKPLEIDVDQKQVNQGHNPRSKGSEGGEC